MTIDSTPRGSLKRKALRAYSDYHTTPASRTAERVCLQLERGSVELAHAAIDDFAREMAERAARPGRHRPATVAELLLAPIAELQLSARTINELERCGILHVDDFAKGQWSRLRVLAIPGFGEKTFAEIERALDKHGLPGFFRTEAADGGEA